MGRFRSESHGREMNVGVERMILIDQKRTANCTEDEHGLPAVLQAIAAAAAITNSCDKPIMRSADVGVKPT